MIKKAEINMGLFGKKDYFTLGVKAYQQGNYSQMIFNWEKAVEQGNANAQYNLGICYENGQGVEKDLKKAFDLFHSAAQNKHTGSQYKIGVYYAEGIYVLRNIKEAMKWLEKAAKQGDKNAIAQFDLLKDEMSNGTLVKKLLDCAKIEEKENDLEKALNDYEQAAEIGDAKVQYNLAKIYEKGQITQKDSKKAFVWCEKAANQGFMYAQLALGMMYEKGIGCIEDKDAAIRYYERAAEQGNVTAQYYLAVNLLNKENWEDTIREALLWLEKAAEQGDEKAKEKIKRWSKMNEILEKAKQGNIDAQVQMAQSYEKSNRANKEKRIFYWYEKAAEQGDTHSQIVIGIMYSFGAGVEKNIEFAIEWMEKAAEQGEIEKQEYHLALLYLIRDLKNRVIYDPKLEASKNRQRAEYWLEKAIERGHGKAAYKLAELWMEEKDIENRIDKIIDLFKQAIKAGCDEAKEKLEIAVKISQTISESEDGNADAMFELAWLFDEGKKIYQSDRKAFEWYQKAAEQGNAKAQNNLANMYASGRGCTERMDLAVFYRKKAANAGIAQAQFNLGYAYEAGIFVKQNYQRAMMWYQNAAKQKYYAAYTNIGYLYEKGFGVSVDKEKALEWYQEAANAGDGIGQYNMGCLYQDGKWVKQDKYQAERLWKAAADQGYAISQYRLAIKYLEEEEFNDKLFEVIDLLDKAASNGNDNAVNKLKELEKDSDGLSPYKVLDVVQAVEKGMLDIENSLISCTYEYVGEFYMNGKYGFPKNMILAKKWKRKAAELGFDLAQYNMAVIYRNEGNRYQAKQWMERAASQNFLPAKKALQEWKW